MSHTRQPVAEVLADPTTTPARRTRLETVAEVLDFAASDLALPTAGAYQSFVATGRDALVWNVVVAPEFSVKARRWCHLVAGCVPYLGWFDRTAAERFAERHARRGDDAALFPAAAYSTLGWFDDPLTDVMIADGDLALAGRLIHELAHRRLYVPGDTAFSESYARFVEREGVERWLRARGDGAGLARWARLGHEADQARILLRDARRALAAIYASTEPASIKRERRSRILADLVLALDAEAGSAEAWVGTAPNNAHLALANAYAGGHCAFVALLTRYEGDFAAFHRAAAAVAEGDHVARAEWLETPCPAPPGDGIAPPDGL